MLLSRPKYAFSVVVDCQRAGSNPKSGFAVPRWWSRGDSNRRSSLAFCPLETARSSGRFRPESLQIARRTIL